MQTASGEVLGAIESIGGAVRAMGDDNLKVYIDQAYEGFGVAEGERLFSPQGEPTPILDYALSFLRTYQGEIRRTREFVDRLTALDLLAPRVLDMALPGQSALKVQGFSVVDEQKLNALADAALLDLARSGFLAWIYAHLWSLANVTRFAERLAPQADRTSRPPAGTATAGQPVSLPEGGDPPSASASIPGVAAPGLDLGPATPPTGSPDAPSRPASPAESPRRGPTRRRS